LLRRVEADTTPSFEADGDGGCAAAPEAARHGTCSIRRFYILLWLLGVPLGLIIILALLRGA